MADQPTHTAGAIPRACAEHVSTAERLSGLRAALRDTSLSAAVTKRAAAAILTAAIGLSGAALAAPTAAAEPVKPPTPTSCVAQYVQNGWTYTEARRQCGSSDKPRAYVPIKGGGVARYDVGQSTTTPKPSTSTTKPKSGVERAMDKMFGAVRVGLILLVAAFVLYFITVFVTELVRTLNKAPQPQDQQPQPQPQQQQYDPAAYAAWIAQQAQATAQRAANVSGTATATANADADHDPNTETRHRGRDTSSGGRSVFGDADDDLL